MNIPNRLPTYPVRGTIVVNGDPIEAISVFFNSVSPQERVGYHTRGVTDKYGRIAVTTYDVGDGVPAGEYVLTFSKRLNILGEDSPDELNERYEKVQESKHRVTVANGPVDLGEIELITK